MSIIQIENLLPWSNPKQIDTKVGTKMLRKAYPDKKFWEIWKEKKDELKKLGISVSKFQDEWEVAWWQDLSPEVIKALNQKIEASRAAAASSNFFVPVPEGLKMYPFQEAGVEYVVQFPHALIADEMGCIDGDANIYIHNTGDVVTLDKLYFAMSQPINEFADIKYFTNSLFPDGTIRKNQIKKILFKGSKRVIEISVSIKIYDQCDESYIQKLKLTPDHEVCLEDGKWIQSQDLNIGDRIKTCFHPESNRYSIGTVVDSLNTDQYRVVYDLVMDEPARNFIANGIIVHNCGKTVQALGVINYYPDVKKVVCVVPNSIKINWKNEAAKWLLNKKLNIGIVTPKMGWPTNAQFVIVNYEQLTKYQKELTSTEWDIAIVDESHKIKNPATKRAKAVLAINAKRFIFLTGTPVLNKPAEVFTTLQKIDPTGLGKDKYKFYRRFCGYDGNGATNLEELQKLLRSRGMIRRLKADVLKELPPKIRQVITLETNGSSATVEREKQLVAQRKEKMFHLKLKAEMAKLHGDEEYKQAVQALKSYSSLALSEIAKVRHELALEKVPYAISHIEDIFENDVDSLIVFAHHKDVLQKLKDHFGNDAVVITGDTKIEDRDQAVRDFQEKRAKLFLGTIGAAGVGLTLTAASRVVFVELDWVPGNVSQAEDRAHRITQTLPVTVQHLVFDGSLDAHMAKILIAKQEIIDRSLNNKVEGDTVSVEAKKEIEFDETLLSTGVEGVATNDLTVEQIEKRAKEIDSETAQNIHRAISMLAGTCDGAVQVDGVGFNRFDSEIGKSLAMSTELSPKQAAFAQKLVQKYQRQLPRTLVESCGVKLKDQ